MHALGRFRTHGWWETSLVSNRKSGVHPRKQDHRVFVDQEIPDGYPITRLGLNKSSAATVSRVEGGITINAFFSRI